MVLGFLQNPQVVFFINFTVFPAIFQEFGGAAGQNSEGSWSQAAGTTRPISGLGEGIFQGGWWPSIIGVRKRNQVRWPNAAEGPVWPFSS
jgi:hypothetical protein